MPGNTTSINELTPGVTMRQKKHGSIKKERAMRNRTMILILAIIVVALLTVGGTVSAMALTNSGFIKPARKTPGFSHGDRRAVPCGGEMGWETA